MDSGLRDELVRYVARKFTSWPNIAHLADDIVNEGYERLLRSPSYADDKMNFGYLSVTCIRIAYRMFMDEDRRQSQLTFSSVESTLAYNDEFVDEIIRADDATAILDSLCILREVERIVLKQRYYMDFSFQRIADENNLKINTVLSHHRRALEKLQPYLGYIIDTGKDGPDEG